MMFAPGTVSSAALALLFTAGPLTVDAFPGFAGTCNVDETTGPAFPAGNVHAGNQNGTLGEETSPYEVTIGGTVLSSAGMDVTAGTDHEITLSGIKSARTFKGFLFTLQAQGEDLSGSFDRGSVTQARILESEGDGTDGGGAPNSITTCASTISGATHLTSGMKNSIKFNMNIAVPDGGPSNLPESVSLTVTVMEMSTRWYFATFPLAVLAPPPSTEMPTSSPTSTMMPTSSTAMPTPVSMAPTAMPVAGGETTEEPTAAPSGATMTTIVGGRSVVGSAVAAAFSVVGMAWLFA